MALRRDPTVLGAVMGPPLDRRTWSGASHHLFTAWRRRGVLVGAVDARPPEWAQLAAKVLAVAPSRQRWRERYEYSPVIRAQSEAAATRALRRVDPRPDVLLQVGAYYDFTRRQELRPRLRCSFNDANLALYRRSGVFIEDAEAPHVRAMMRHEERVLAGLDLVMPMSRWLADSFVHDFGQDPDKVVVVGSGVNNDHVPPPAPRDWGTPHLLFVGFDAARKGLPIVVAAFRGLRLRHPEATLTVVGPPAPTSDAAREPGVVWTGPIDRSTTAGDLRLQELHQQSTAFVMMPGYDPMPNAVLEAMAHGLPVVGPRSGSMPEMVLHGKTGLLVDERTPEAVTAALDELAGDPSRARDMGVRGAQRIAAHFTWDRVVSRMAEAMTARLEGRPA